MIVETIAWLARSTDSFARVDEGGSRFPGWGHTWRDGNPSISVVRQQTMSLFSDGLLVSGVYGPEAERSAQSSLRLASTFVLTDTP